MLILTHDTLRNPAILKVRQLPRKFFGRVTVRPKEQLGFMLRLRMFAEFPAERYGVTLSPFVAVGALWNDVALSIAQAPILMFGLIWWVEMRLLRLPVKKTCSTNRRGSN